MGGGTIDYEEEWKLAQGTIELGGRIMMTFDFTDGLTKEQFMEKREREDTGTIFTKDGRVLMPKLNIY